MLTGYHTVFPRRTGDVGEAGLEHESVVYNTEQVNHIQVYTSKYAARRTKEVTYPEWRKISSPHLIWSSVSSFEFSITTH